MEGINFKRPELEDQEIIDQYYKKYPTRDCGRTFASVFLWSRAYQAEYAIVADTLVVKTGTGGISFMYPAGSPENVKKAVEILIAYTKELNVPFKMHGVSVENAAELEELFPEMFQVEYNRDWADYVYEREKLATLSGKKLHGKRNHINKFKAVQNDWSYETLTEENLEECFQMALKWRNENGVEEDEEKNHEMNVTMNSLRLFRELKATGGILRVDGQVVAFTIGEPVNDDTFVVHIEKAFADIEGTYPMINQQFVQHECMDYQYINREDDTGAEGLRKAKLSYRPVFLIEKGVATLKG